MTQRQSVLGRSLVGLLLLAAGCGVSAGTKGAADEIAACEGKCDSQLEFDATPIPIPPVSCALTEDQRAVACAIDAPPQITAQFQIHAAPQKPPSAPVTIGAEPTAIALAPEDFGKIKVLVRWYQQLAPGTPPAREIADEAFVSPDAPAVVFETGYELWPIRVVSYDLAALPTAYVSWKTALHGETRQVTLDATGSDGLFLLPVNPEALLTMRAARYQYSSSYATAVTISKPGMYQIQPESGASTTKLTLVPVDTLAWPDDANEPNDPS